MNDPKSPADPAKSLMAEDTFLDSSAYGEHRRRLLARIAAAEKREKRSRALTIAICAGCLPLFFSAYGLALLEMKPGAEWPEWVPLITVMTVILSPLIALLILGLYFFRHRRELVRARKAAREQTIRDLPGQIMELRREMEELRKQLRAERGDPGAAPAQKGFTLTEMLVVIATLGILTALLFPSLAGAKSRARMMTCQNNLGQIGKALAMYEGETGFYPGAGDTAIQTNQPPWSVIAPDSWIVRLRPYLGRSAAVFDCPEALSPRYFGPDKVESFGYNAAGSGARNNFSGTLGLGFGRTKFVRANDVKAPADMIAIGDLQLPPSLWINDINPIERVAFGHSLDSLIPARHRGGANMLFTDSHAEWAKQAPWIAANSASRLRWNLDHQPHPETW